MKNLKELNVDEIAEVIEQDWSNVNYAARPYLQAMKKMVTHNLNGYYMFDPMWDIVARFLANASTWKGEVARAVKKELNRRLKS